VSIFDELFNPSARFRDEEKNRLEWMRDEEGEGDPHRGPIDLDSGAVRIRVPGGDGTPQTDVDASADGDSGTQPG
jgi:hypothetical protein